MASIGSSSSKADASTADLAARLRERRAAAELRIREAEVMRREAELELAAVHALEHEGSPAVQSDEDAALHDQALHRSSDPARSFQIAPSRTGADKARSKLSGLACFDVTSWPCSWRSATPCERCSILEGKERGASFSSYLASTQCQAQQKQEGVMRCQLPVEVVDIILSEFILMEQPRFKRSGSGFIMGFTRVEKPAVDLFTALANRNEVKLKNELRNTTLRALLHTSLRVRASIAKHFVPRTAPCWRDRDKRTTTHPRDSPINARLDIFVRQAVHWYLGDFAQRKLRPLELPSSNETVLVGEQDCTAWWTVTLIEQPPEPTHDKPSVTSYRRTKEWHASYLKGNSVDVYHACLSLGQALIELWPPPQHINPFYRLLGDADAWVDAPAELAVTLHISDANVPDQVWIFQDSPRLTPCPCPLFARASA